MNLSKLTLVFNEKIHGYWDYGKKAGGVFSPTVYSENDSNKSCVEWGCWELNHYFRFPLHYEHGKQKNKPMSGNYVMGRARRYLREKTRIPCKIFKGNRQDLLNEIN